MERKKFVIYTISVGNYDKVLQPLVIDDRFDYVLFSNDYEENQIGVWHVHPIPDDIASDNKRLSRYPKTHPETLLSQYVASLYHDANIQIATQQVYNRVVELYESRIEYAGLMHDKDDCIYEHTYRMCMLGVEYDYNAIIQCHKLYKLGFPLHYGMNENNVIYRCHTENMRKADEEWWWWITHYSFRDQFSYMYCLWKFHIKNNYIFPAGEYARNSKNFKFTYHDAKSDKKKFLEHKGLELLRLRCRSLSSFHRQCYLRHYLFMLKLPHPVLALNIWGLLVGIINSPLLTYNVVKHKIVKFIEKL